MSHEQRRVEGACLGGNRGLPTRRLPVLLSALRGRVHTHVFPLTKCYFEKYRGIIHMTLVFEPGQYAELCVLLQAISSSATVCAVNPLMKADPAE